MSAMHKKTQTTQKIKYFLFFSLLFLCYSYPLYGQEQQRLVIVPLAEDSESQIVGDIIAQKLLVFLQTDKRTKTRISPKVTFATTSRESETEFRNAVQRQIDGGSSYVIIVWARKTQKEFFDVRLIFFHKSQNEKFAEKKARVKLEKALGEDDFFGNNSNLSKIEIVNLLSYEKQDETPLRRTERIYYKETTLRFDPEWNGTTLPPAYFVEINGKRNQQNSPRQVTLSEAKNYVEIFQETVSIGSFNVSLSTEKASVPFALLSEDEILERKEKVTEKSPHLNYWFTVDVLGGWMQLLYTTHPLAANTENFSGPAGLLRLVMHPSNPYLQLGIEVSFSAPIDGSGENRSLLGASAFIGTNIPLVSRLDLGISLGGGYFFSNSQMGQFTPAPHILAGVLLAYNVPVKTAGYFRVLLETNVYASFANITFNANPGAQRMNNVHLGIFAGIGWRF